MTPYEDRQRRLRSSSARRRLTAADRVRLAEDISKGPRSFGYPSNGWTGSLLAQHTEAVTGRVISPKTARSMLRQAGLVWSAPNISSGGPGTFRHVRVARRMVAEAMDDPRPAWFADETRFTLGRDSWGSWRPPGAVGSGLRRESYNGGSLTFVGAVRDDGAFVCRNIPSPCGQAFVALLLVLYSRGDCIVVADRAPYHASAPVAAFLESHSGLDLRLLPSKTSQVSPIEIVWDMLRGCIEVGEAAVTGEKLLELIGAQAERWREPDPELAAVMASFRSPERRGAGGPVYE